MDDKSNKKLEETMERMVRDGLKNRMESLTEVSSVISKLKLCEEAQSIDDEFVSDLCKNMELAMITHIISIGLWTILKDVTSGPDNVIEKYGLEAAQTIADHPHACDFEGKGTDGPRGFLAYLSDVAMRFENTLQEQLDEIKKSEAYADVMKDVMPVPVVRRN